MNWKSAPALFAAFLVAIANLPAQFVEVEAVIDLTSWNYQEETGLALKNRRTFPVRCVVGTNLWFMENQFRTNYKESIWFTDGKVIRQFTATQDTASDADESLYLPTRRGGRSANIIAAEDGYPTGEMSITLPWFAFCSGPYFKRPGRSVPLPVSSADSPAFGLRDETTVFKDKLGLPQRVDLYTSKGHIKCEYRVQQFTNMLGCSFPTAFTVVQHEPGPFEQWRRQLTASGRVTGIRRAPKPELPADIQARLEMLERYPTRRR